MWHQVSKTPKFPRKLASNACCQICSHVCFFLWAHLITLYFNESYIFFIYIILGLVQKICYLIASGFKRCSLDCWFEYNLYLLNLKTTALHAGVKTCSQPATEHMHWLRNGGKGRGRRFHSFLSLSKIHLQTLEMNRRGRKMLKKGKKKQEEEEKWGWGSGAQSIP